MRKLLNTLYVMTDSCYLVLEGENIVIQNGDKTLGRFPLHTLENIVCFTYKGATPALMGACAERKIGMSFFHHTVSFSQGLLVKSMEMSCCVKNNIGFLMIMIKVHVTQKI